MFVPKTPKELTMKLVSLGLESGESRAQLAKRMGLAPTTLGKWGLGETTPTLDALMSFAKGLGYKLALIKE